jgi:cytochrome P450
MPFLGSLFQARRDPLRFAMDLTRNVGDIVKFRIGFYTGYLLNHPDYFHHVLSLNNRNYNKENYNYRKLKPVLGEGLITANGDRWLEHRRLIQPAFQRKQIADFGETTIQAAKDMLEQWGSSYSTGRSLDVAAEMMELTLKIITTSLFSNHIRSSTEIVRKAFTVLNEDVAYRFKTAFVPPLWIPTKRNRVFKKAREELDKLVYEIIDRRRKSSNSQNDLLDILLAAHGDSGGEQKGLTDRELRDEVMTLMLAGHETTANLLTWSCYLLSRHPEAEQKLRNEITEVLDGRDPVFDDLPSLNYTKKVLQESLRLYPPVWIISRNAISDDVIDGYSIPAGATVTLCSYTLHRHQEFWENPEEFNPGRFTKGQNDNRHQYAYLPFGGGPRSCIGKHFAMMEALLILAMIYRRYHLKLVPEQTVVPEPLVTLRPRHGLKMILEPVST